MDGQEPHTKPVKPKTPSQRLREVLYILYTQQPDGFTNSEDFYNDRIEKLINQVKGRLTQ